MSYTKETSIDSIEKTKAALFAFFLGAFGIHDFILGNPKRGVLKIFLSLTNSLVVPYIIWVFLTYTDLKNISCGTYPNSSKLLVGDDAVAFALSIIFLVLGFIGSVIYVALTFLAITLLV